MKKLLLVCALGITGLVSAKESKQDSNVKNLEQKEQKVFTRFLITLKTVCGTTHQTVFDTSFDSDDCLYNEWEMYNKQDCGHTSYENGEV
jgi:hypothetical protein